MIYHLTPAGVPISWMITAIYDTAYGIAHTAAKAWHEKEGQPQFVVEIKDGEATRSNMLWAGDHKQYSMQQEIFIQGFRKEPASVVIDDETRQQLSTIMHAALTEQEFLIPHDEWVRRYPGSHMVSERFAEFFEAQKNDPDLAFEDKWAMMMEPPKDYQAAYRVERQGKGYGLMVNREGMPPPPDKNWREITDAETVCRQMNSGWSYEEALVLLKQEPVKD